MIDDGFFRLSTTCPVKAQNAGLFVSRGKGTHPTRIIHTHELIFVKDGELAMWEEDQIFELQAGQTLHLFPGRRHGGLRPNADGLKFFWVHFELLPAMSSFPGYETLDVPQTNEIRHPERLENLFRQFLDRQEAGDLDTYSASLMVMLMLVEASRYSNIDESADANVIATRAHTYLRIHYDQPLTPGKIAETLGYNPDYLGRIYRKVFGCTLTEAIHRRRIHMAQRYLMESEMTIEQVALACGFTNPDYFRSIFRRYTQTTPGSYRNLFARIHINTQ